MVWETPYMDPVQMKPPKIPKPGALVRVVWLDSARHLGGNDGWLQREDCRYDAMEMTSVGWVWEASVEAITLAPHTDMAQSQAYGVLSIPWCAVTVVDILQARK